MKNIIVSFACFLLMSLLYGKNLKITLNPGELFVTFCMFSAKYDTISIEILRKQAKE